MVCTFFGHRNTLSEIEPQLRATLIRLIEKEGVDSFYVGHQGNFDRMVYRTLGQLKAIYPHIRYAVVLAYLPVEKETVDLKVGDTLYPDGLETTPPKFAIVKRNRWMIERADYVVTYVTHLGGGAAKFKELAEKKKKIVVNLPEQRD